MTAGSNTFNKVLHILNLGNNHHFLQFPGGAGGDYISGLVSEYSKNYLPNVTYAQDNNKFKTVVPYFFRIMTSMSSNDTEDKDDTKLAEHWLLDHEKFKTQEKYNLEKILLEAEDWLNQGKRLIRIHASYYKYFENKTYFLYPDTDYWKQYCRFMMTLKLYTREITKQEFITISLHYVESLQNSKKEAHPQYQNLQEFLSTYTKPILQGHIYLIQYFDMFSSFDTLFSLTEDEVFSFLYNNVDLPMNPMYRKMSYKKMNNIKLLPMSKTYLEKDFLANVFEIDDPYFFSKVNEWHEKNKTLLREKGITI